VTVLVRVFAFYGECRLTLGRVFAGVRFGVGVERGVVESALPGVELVRGSGLVPGISLKDADVPRRTSALGRIVGCF
jgi:hypothetical protein